MSDDPRPENEEEQEERPRIKVTDRRLFDREGNLREDVAEEQQRSPSPHTPKVDAERPDPGAAGGPGPAEGSDRGPGGGPGKPPAPGAGPGGRAGGSEASAPGGTAPRGPAGPGRSTGAGQGAAGGPSGVEIPGPEDTDEAAPGGTAGERPSASDLPRDFPAFVESQYFEALLYLGAVPHPQTGEKVEDLDFARYKIDLLGMIQDKTEGNLDSEEEDFLEKVLADLRMRFTQASRGGS